MSSRTCRSTTWNVEAALRAACLILVSVTAGGCVLGNDNDRPVLAVDPLWDVAPGSLFSGDTCREAGVVFMTWNIKDDRGHSLKKSSKLENCQPLDFIGLVPGTYRLELAGFDREGVKRWETTCPPFELGRFDTLHECEVDQVSPDEAGPDAGTPVDASEPDAG